MSIIASKHSEHDNPRYVVVAWAGSLDLDDEMIRLESIEPNDEESVKSAIERDILKNFLNNMNEEHRRRSIDGLRQLLSYGNDQIERLWASELIALRLPKNPRDIVIWIQDVFEKYQIHVR